MKLICVLHVAVCSSIYCGFSAHRVDLFFQEQATAVFLQDYLKKSCCTSPDQPRLPALCKERVNIEEAEVQMNGLFIISLFIIYIIFCCQHRLTTNCL